ncbi:MAG: hypothetical protein IJ877_00800 [Candidatus Gastranaerophilales bacterium]|nr:hypothetical protein [Candidatus Gastranaerophilales bacterium]
MRVPRIGGIYTPRVKRNNASEHYKKLSDPPAPKDDAKSAVSFGTSVAYYLKKYATLPPEIQKTLTPKDAIDMFREMEYVANGVVKRKTIGQGAESKVYENPWLEGYHFIVLNNPNDAKLSSETIYSKMNHIGDAVWCDGDDSRIQLLTS